MVTHPAPTAAVWRKSNSRSRPPFESRRAVRNSVAHRRPLEEVGTAVVVSEENTLVRQWRIAALNNVERLTRSDDSGHPRHADNLPLACAVCKMNGANRTMPTRPVRFNS